MFVFFARHLSRFYGDKAGGHEVGGLLCHGSVFVGTELMCRHLMNIFTLLDWSLPQPSPLSLFVFWMKPLCATINGRKTWKFKHMLTAIVHLKQQKWWMQYYLRSTLPECQRAVLSNITFTIFAVLNVQSPLTCV